MIRRKILRTIVVISAALNAIGLITCRRTGKHTYNQKPQKEMKVSSSPFQNPSLLSLSFGLYLSWMSSPLSNRVQIEFIAASGTVSSEITCHKEDTRERQYKNFNELPSCSSCSCNLYRNRIAQIPSWPKCGSHLTIKTSHYTFQNFRLTPLVIYFTFPVSRMVGPMTYYTYDKTQVQDSNLCRLIS